MFLVFQVHTVEGLIPSIRESGRTPPNRAITSSAGVRMDFFFVMGVDMWRTMAVVYAPLQLE